jgi:hypothetical protein
LNARFDQEHDERPRANPRLVGGYLTPTIVVLFTILWVLLSYWLIGWRARDWQFGTVPYVPAESPFTTQRQPTGPAPKQVELPKPTPGGSHAKR